MRKIRPLISVWKDIQIFFEWLFEEIKNDTIYSSHRIISKETYIELLRKIKNIFKDFLGTFTKPKNKVYLSLLIYILVVAITDVLWLQIIAFLLIFYFYFKKLWQGGEPLKFYKEKYYGKDSGFVEKI